MRKINCLFIAMVGMMSLTSLHAEVKLQTSIDKTIITIGDIVSYQVKLIYTDSIKTLPPELASNLGQFEIKDFITKNPYQNEQKEWVKEYEYKITAFFVGNFIIPPLSFYFTNPKGQKFELKSSEQRLEVKSLTTAADQDIKDIKNPMVIPYNYRPLLILCSVLLLLGGGLGWYWFYYRNRQQLIPGQSEDEIFTPEEEAHNYLNDIRQKYLEDDSLCKEFYIHISYLIRRLIERKFQVNALEETTPRIINSIRKIQILQDGNLVFLQDLLEESDLVKFAKFFQPYPRRNELVERVEKFIIILTANGIDSSPAILTEDNLETTGESPSVLNHNLPAESPAPMRRSQNES